MEIKEILTLVIGILAVLVTALSYYLSIRNTVTLAAHSAVGDVEDPDKTGAEKMAAAVEQVYALVPVVLKGIINKKIVESLVQAAFDKIEVYAKKQAEKTK
jgi:hypothetical protein